VISAAVADISDTPAELKTGKRSSPTREDATARSVIFTVRSYFVGVPGGLAGYVGSRHQHLKRPEEPIEDLPVCVRAPREVGSLREILA